MKRLIVSALLLTTSVGGFSQEINFKVSENNDVIWQKVFEINSSFDSLYLQLQKKGYFSHLDTLGNSIIGELKRTDIDYSGSKDNLWKSDVPIYIKKCDIVAFFEIEYKPFRYRVTLKNIKCIGKSENGNGFFDIKPNEMNSLSFFALKNKKFDKPFLKYSIPILEKNFSSFFSTDNKKGNW
jgi:hypothetical protein